LTVSDGPAGFSLAGVLGMARLCLREARPAEAELAARKALLLAPGEAACHAMLSLALLDLGRLPSAATAAEAALALAPRKPMLLNLAARIAARRGLYQEALRLVETCLDIQPFDIRALATRPSLLHALGRAQDTPPLLDYGRLIRRIPSLILGSSNQANAFHRQVAAAIASAPALRPADPGRTLVGGARLATLATLPGGLGDRLLQLFEEAVVTYVAGLAQAACVVTAARPDRFRVVAWASVMSEGDFERAHIHETGWVSGVYYPEMPANLTELDASESGAIVFGGSDMEEAGLRTPTCFSVIPRLGELVLFPSYFTHRTIPFTGSGRRISVAFDARPASEAAVC
jgi:hypothetical protein